MNYLPIIGLEIHVQLKTESKAFCDCASGKWQDAPNTHTCPVCLGLPGALPVVNSAAVEKAIQVGIALKCTVSRYTFFERKNYFYPDLPKGFQISQYRYPLATDGYVFIDNKRIRVNRVHLEEDTAKSIHAVDGTYLDFNKSGTPLLEIVSEPDINSAKEAGAYCKKIQKIVRALEVSDADMEKGQMRLEANISLWQRDKNLANSKEALPNYRVEIKNINSFRYLEQAIEYEVERQTRKLEKGEQLHMETRGFDNEKGVTYVQRTKEEAHDYRYFPEPDIPPLHITEKWITKLKHSIPELPAEKAQRFVDKFNLRRDYATLLAEDKYKANLFERAVKLGGQAAEVANWIINRPADIEGLDARPLIKKIEIEKENIVKEKDELSTIIKNVVANNQVAVSDYKSGKERAIQFLLGQVMKETGGKAHPQTTLELLRKVLDSN